MNCQKAERLFYEIGEERLDPSTLTALRAHEASCSHCRSQFAIWRKCRAALQSEEMRIAPPPDFTAGVMAQLEAEPQPVQSWQERLLSAFRNSVLSRGLAAAAVVVALLMGSLFYAGKLFPGTTTPQIAQKTPQQQNEQTAPAKNHFIKKQTADHNASEQVQETTPSKTDSQKDEADSSKEAQDKPTATDSAVKKPSKSTQIAGGTELKFNFLDNKKRVITTSMVKIGVADLEQTQQAVAAIAQSEGAQLASTVTAQNNGQPNLILRYTVSPAQAEIFISKLERLGTVKTRDKSVNDVTANFSRTLEEYRSVEAKIADASPDERERLKSQAEFLARQLEDWDQSSEKQVVVLWLEKS